MTGEERQLLLADLCARLPYGAKCKVETCAPPATIASINDEGGVTVRLVDKNGVTRGIGWDDLVDIKPYLRPMESMTDEEGKEYNILLTTGQCFKLVDYLNRKMFDYRGLIPMGLALPAPDGMYNGQND